MKIAIGSDHGGFDLKENLREYLISLGHDVIDCGCYSKDRVDYPVYCKKVCLEVQKDARFGVLVCTTGIGMSICSNKYIGIRSALVMNLDQAKMTREHNDSNIICFGAKYVDSYLAKEALDLFLNTEFIGGRHEERVKMIEEAEYERKRSCI